MCRCADVQKWACYYLIGCWVSAEGKIVNPLAILTASTLKPFIRYSLFIIHYSLKKPSLQKAFLTIYC